MPPEADDRDLETVIHDALGENSDELVDEGVGDEPTDDSTDEATDDAAEVTVEPAVDATADASVEPVADGTPVADKPSPDAAAAAARAKELESYGLKADKPGQRESRIPRSKVTKIIGNAEKKITERLTATHKTELDQYQSIAKEFNDLGEVARTDPERFIGLLATRNPAYQKFLDRAKGTTEPVKEPVADVAAAPEMPQPDVKLADGSVGYSPQGLAKLLDWNSQVTTTKVLDTVTKQYKPVQDAFAADQTRRELMPKVQAKFDQMKKYPGFEDNFNEILAVLQKYPNISPDEAYVHVVTPKLVGDRNTMRTEILAEQAAKAKAGAHTGRSAVGSVRKPVPAEDDEEAVRSGVDPLEAIIVKAMEDHGMLR